MWCQWVPVGSRPVASTGLLRILCQSRVSTCVHQWTGPPLLGVSRFLAVKNPNISRLLTDRCAPRWDQALKPVLCRKSPDCFLNLKIRHLRAGLFTPPKQSRGGPGNSGRFPWKSRLPPVDSCGCIMQARLSLRFSDFERPCSDQRRPEPAQPREEEAGDREGLRL